MAMVALDIGLGVGHTINLTLSSRYNVYILKTLESTKLCHPVKEIDNGCRTECKVYDWMGIQSTNE